ncbi:laccase-2 precursor [Massarina eburnea CBS 473.64]|uniref:Laccase-2 n=1 Tax=Massarina eburnea CBS 473.64 TaxID=1395130 RepID=A0A6A6S106_9PLEO|nr:laccase-2 precursor [Massarina eburnea CBS 473.64]
MYHLSLIATFATVALSKTVRYDFDIGWVTAAPDGFARPVQGINGQWPLPIIEATAKDTVIVKIHNSLGNESTSLHFHGQYQFGTGASDGVVGVGQCPLYPGQSYTYKFTAWPPGTHWYHSHAEGAYPDGLRGKMIIHDPAWEASLNVSQQIPLSMSDWYHEQMPYAISEYLSVNNTNGDIPAPSSFLFNDTTTPPQFNFEPKKRYLLRIVNMAALACGEFHIEGHVLSVVAVDGQPVHPKDANVILVCAGQRYDVVVVGKEAPLSSVQYIVKMSTDMLTGQAPLDDNIIVVGNLTYVRNGVRLPINPSFTKLLGASWTASSVLDDTTLIPLDNQPLLTGVTKRVNFRTNQTYYEGIGTRIGVSDQPYIKPKVPALLMAISTGRNAWDPSTYGPGASPQITKLDDVVQIYMENPQAFPHPMHLHVVVIPADGYIVLRYQSKNPGVWLFHCHIDFHLVGGMAAIFVEAPDVLQKQQKTSAQNIATCKTSKMCPMGNCACGQGPLSVQDSNEECNIIFNDHSANLGSLILS